MLEFRPAGNDSFSDGAPQFGIPSFVQQQHRQGGSHHGAASSLHIVVLKPLPQAAAGAEAEAWAAADVAAGAHAMLAAPAEAGLPPPGLPRLHPPHLLPASGGRDSPLRATPVSLGSDLEPETPRETHEQVLEASAAQLHVALCSGTLPVRVGSGNCELQDSSLRSPAGRLACHPSASCARGRPRCPARQDLLSWPMQRPPLPPTPPPCR